MSEDAYISFRLDRSEFESQLNVVEQALRGLGSVTVTRDEEGIEEIRQLGGAFVDEKALEVAASAAPPVDTGFLRASAYVYSNRQDSFDATWPSDYYTSTKTGYLRARERAGAPQHPADEYGAVAGWAAVYAWWVEDAQPFIYAALMGMAGAEDRGPLNLGGRRFVSPRGVRARDAGDGGINRNSPNFVSPHGPSSPPGDGTAGPDPSNRNFVSPDGPAADSPGDGGIDRGNRNFVAP
jgi:hypothetical protein